MGLVDSAVTIETITTGNQDRTCFYCKNSDLCFAFKNIDREVKNSIRILNIDYGETPGTYQDIYKALAGACFKFVPYPKG